MADPDPSVTVATVANTTYMDHFDAPWLTLGIVGFIVMALLAITYVVVVLTTARLRTDPGKWLQVVVSVAIVMDSFWFLMGAIMWMHGVSSKSTCLAMLAFVWTGEFMIGINANLLTLERLISVWRQDYRVSGFTDREALLAVGVSVVVTIAVVMALLCGLGSPVVRFSQWYGIHYCTPTQASHSALNISMSVLQCVMLLLTVLLTARLWRSRRREAEPYPYQRVLHVLIGNVLLLINEAAMYLQFNLSTFMIDTIMFFHLGLLLLWLLLDSSVRVPLRRICCPFCPGPEPYDDSVELVEDWINSYSTCFIHCSQVTWERSWPIREDVTKCNVFPHWSWPFSRVMVQECRMIGWSWYIQINELLSPIVMCCSQVIARTISSNGPLTRYIKLRVVHAPRMPGTFSPPPTSQETAS